MALQFSTAVRNAMLDAIETETGATAVLKIRTGAAPANCAAADSGTVVATITLAADWAAAAAAGQKSFANLPITDASADADGDAAHWRLYASDGVTCHAQGTYGVAGTDIVGDSVEFTTGQTFNITAWTWTAPGA